MKEKGSPKKAKKAAAKRPARSRARGIILLDSGPIRAAALQEYRELEEHLGSLRRTLEEYETVDLPAYRRWEAATLGPLLSELRTLAAELEQKRDLLDAIAEEQAWSGCSAVAAYRRVMREMKDAEMDDPAGEEEGPDRAARDDDDEDGRPKLFGDSDLPEGLNAAKFDRMSAAKQQALRDYFEQMAMLYEAMTGFEVPGFDELLEATRERGRGDSHEHGARAGAHRHEAPSARPAPKNADSRLKELYRRLVRELHPDLKGEQTAREREFWHQVQDAYQAGDLARLEALAGRVDVGLVGSAEHVPVQVLLRMAKDLREAMTALIGQLRAAKDHPAWNFRKKGASLAKFATRRRRELSVGLESLRAEVTYFRSKLESLAAKATKPGPKKRARAQRGTNGFPQGQADFDF